MLIKKLSLLGFNVKIRKNTILERDNKDLALLISLSTFLLKEQSFFYFPSLFNFIFPIVYKLPLSTKTLKKDTSKPQSKNLTQLAGCSASSLEHTQLSTSLPQYNVFPLALASTSQTFLSTILNTPLLK